MGCFATLWANMNRRKTLPKDLMETPLKRCLNIGDLTMIGIGNMMGAGVFMLTGIIAKDKAGPGVILSYLLSGFAVFLSSLSYAEYGSRIPKAGSAYTYAYMTLGEFWAFIVGWNVLLQRILSAASLARGWSSMLDAMFHSEIRNATIETFGEIDAPGISPYPDLMALSVTLIVVVLVSVGVKFVANLNLAFTILNILALVIIIAVGFWKSDWSNWSSEALGGFLPYGFQGVVAGAATLFYTFVGFESISIAGEEAVDPATQIPIATILAMLFTTVIYVCAASALTLMIPFSHIDTTAPFPEAFRSLGLDWVVYIVSLGALFGITTSIFIDHYALPRMAYSMAADGIFFKFCGWIHPTTQTPIVATVIFGIIASIMALLLDYKILVEFLSIGTLASFTMVSICVIVNRYQPPDHACLPSEPCTPTGSGEAEVEMNLTPTTQMDTSFSSPRLRKDFQDSQFLKKVPGQLIIYLSILCIMVCGAVLAFFLRFNNLYDVLGNDKLWVMAVVFISLFGTFSAMFMITAYEETNEPKHFSVPLVPHVPGLSIMINIALLVQLPTTAWIRYSIWLAIGLVVYFLYGIRHSTEKRPLVESGMSLTSYSALDSTDPEESLNE